MMGSKYLIAITAMLFGIIAGCSSSETAATVSCSGVTLDFAADVNPIIQSSCTTNSSCHSSGSRNGPGALVTYAQIFSARNAIRSAVSSGSMPQGSRLSADQKNAIICWINNGAQQ